MSNKKNKGGTDRSFGLVFTVVFILIGLFPLISGSPIRWWALIISLLLLMLSFFKPSILKPFNKLWTKLGFILHKIISPLILGAIYFLTVVPTGILMRIAGKDLLNLKIDSDASSYWERREIPGPSPETMKRLY